MRSRLINLALVAGMLLLYSCTSDEVAPANDTFDEVIENGGFVPAAKESFSVLDSTESGFETDTATWVCTTKTMKAEYAGGGDDGFALFNPNASVVYPGSMLQGRSLTQATPDVIAVERAGGVISIDVINGKLIEVNVMSPGGIARINRLNGVRLQEKVIDFVEHMVTSKQQLSPRKQGFRQLLSDAELNI